MSHRFFSERSVIERGRSCGSNHGAQGVSYRDLQQELKSFSGCSLEQTEALADTLKTPQRISNGLARDVYRTRGESLDKLSALRRFFDSHVGKAWPTVLSRLRIVSNRRPDSYRHMLTHLQQIVEEKPQFIDGYPYKNFSESCRFLRPLTSGDLYVDQNGILQKIYDCCHVYMRTTQFQFLLSRQFAWLNNVNFFKYKGIRKAHHHQFSGLRIGTWYKIVSFDVTRAHQEVVRDFNNQLQWTKNGPLVRTVLRKLPRTEIVPASESEILQLEQSC